MKYDLVFFGTGQTSLEALQCLSDEFNIEAVITKPALKTSSGKTKPTDVEIFASEKGIEVFTPSNKNELDDLVKKNKFKSSVAVVLDYGLIIGEKTIDSFPLGILNSHFSLLPKYRGADPIRAAILGGDKMTGVTIIKIVPELDAGPILTWAEYKLNNTITEPELRSDLSQLNCSLLIETLNLYLSGDIDLIGQDSENVSFTSKVNKSDGLLDPQTKDANLLSREIRAYAGWPKSFLKYNDHEIIILEARLSEENIEAGKLVWQDNKLLLGCHKDSLEIIRLQLPGKKPMDSQSFINGYKTWL